MHFEKYEEAEIYFKELEETMPESFSIQFNSFLNDDKIYIQSDSLVKSIDITEKFP